MEERREGEVRKRIVAGLTQQQFEEEMIAIYEALARCEELAFPSSEG